MFARQTSSARAGAVRFHAPELKAVRVDGPLNVVTRQLVRRILDKADNADGMPRSPPIGQLASAQIGGEMTPFAALISSEHLTPHAFLLAFIGKRVLRLPRSCLPA